MTETAKTFSRIQLRNRKLILEAALEVFSQNGFRGTTLDQIAAEAGLSKPNLIYYFASKEDIHRTLLVDLLDVWLQPLRDLKAEGEPREELLQYVHRKLQMSQEMPRESRLFANETLQGAPRLNEIMEGDLKGLVDEKAAIIEGWIAEGKIAKVDPVHLIFSIWALTQHYADFEVQVRAILGKSDPFEGASVFLDMIFRKLLDPET